MANNQLYPPIVNTYMPAFIPTEAGGCKIYFSLSQYNTETEIKGVQVIVNSQKNNQSVVNNNTYPMGVIRKSLNKDDKGYYIIIYSGADVPFTIDNYYKVQLRFDNVEDSVIAPNAAWINSNLDNFSEWSTVCLIKPISEPQLILTNQVKEEEVFTLTSSTLTIAGKLVFNSYPEEDETLRNYKMILRKISDTQLLEGEIIEESDVIYIQPNGPQNTFTYTFKTALEDKMQYSVEIFYTTRNFYQPSSQQLFNIKVDLQQQGETDISILVIPDIDFGRNKIVLYSDQNIDNTGIYYISRSDQRSDFTQWEDIHQINNELIASVTVLKTKNDIAHSLFEHIENNDNSITAQYIWFDNTCELGQFYKYRVQKEIDGLRTNPKYSEKIINDSDQIILTHNDSVLNITYNSSISSIKHVIMESKTDTLGGVYPIIRRNGNVKYKQFGISGLITVLQDNKEAFILKDNLYNNNNNKIDYQNYNDKHNISIYNNYILEKKFRDKVIEFLEDGQPKLFKSLTEGNIIVRLMDVSLSPQTQLNNYIYSFNATAIEIDDINISNYFKYNILTQNGESDFKYIVTQDSEKILTQDEQALISQEGN